LELFRQCFTAPAFIHFQQFALTFWLGEGRRTGTAVWRASAQARHFSCFHRFLVTYRWSPEALGRRLLEVVLAQLGLADRTEGKLVLTIAADDTLTRKFGRRLEGSGWQHDAMAPNPKAPLAFGQCFVVLGLLAATGGRWRCFPFAAWLFRPEQSAGAPHTHETKLALLARRLAGWKLPASWRLRVVADTAYGKRSLAEALWELNYWLISRLPSNAVVFELPPPGEPGPRRRGAPRRYGEKRRLGHFAALAAAAAVTTQRLYGQAWQVRLYAQRVVSKALGGQEILLVTVIRIGKGGQENRPVYLFSTDLALTAAEVVALYAARFAIELAFRELKNHFGFGHCQARRAGAAERHVQLCLVAYTGSQLYAATAAPAGRAEPWRPAPEIATTGQLRRAAQQERQAQITIEICAKHGIPRKIQQAVYADLLRAA
jgi:hypothetical protein